MALCDDVLAAGVDNINEALPLCSALEMTMEPKEALVELQQTLNQITADWVEQPIPLTEERRHLALLRFLAALLKSMQEGRSYRVGWNLVGVGDYIELNADAPISIERLLEGYARFKIEPYNELSASLPIVSRASTGNESYSDDRIISPNPNYSAHKDAESEHQVFKIAEKINELTAAYQKLAGNSNLMAERVQSLTDGYKKIGDVAAESIKDTRKFLEERGVKFKP